MATLDCPEAIYIVFIGICIFENRGEIAMSSLIMIQHYAATRRRRFFFLPPPHLMMVTTTRWHHLVPPGSTLVDSD